jgi:hypothetical protein
VIHFSGCFSSFPENLFASWVSGQFSGGVPKSFVTALVGCGLGGCEQFSQLQPAAIPSPNVSTASTTSRPARGQQPGIMSFSFT